MLTTWDRQARMCFPHLLSPLKRAFKLRPEGRKGTSEKKEGRAGGVGYRSRGCKDPELDKRGQRVRSED